MKKKSARQRLREMLEKEKRQGESPPVVLQAIPYKDIKQPRGASRLVKAGDKITIVNDPAGIPWRKPDDRPCYVCGSNELWESTSGVIICSVCHPPNAEMNVKRFIRLSEGRGKPESDDGVTFFEVA